MPINEHQSMTAHNHFDILSLTNHIAHQSVDIPHHTFCRKGKISSWKASVMDILKSVKKAIPLYALCSCGPDKSLPR